MRASIAAVLVALALGACGSVGEESDGGSGEGQESRPIKVGLVIPQSGVYAPLGEDMKAAWDLWLDENGNKLGGRDVETVVVDEGEGPDTGVPAVQKVLQQDRVDAVVGIVNSATALGAADIVNGAKKLLIVANAGANDVTGSSKYIWRTSFTNGQVAYAIGKHLAAHARGQEGRVRDGRRLRGRRGGDRGLQEGASRRAAASSSARRRRRSGRRRTSSRSWPARSASSRARSTCSTPAPRRCRSSSSTTSSGSPTTRRCTAPASSPRAAC